MDLGLTNSTVADARERFAHEFFPNDTSDPAFLVRLNEVIERYHTMEKWVGSRATYRIDVSEDKTFFLPYYLESVINANLDKTPAIVQGDRYQFAYDGVGEVDAQGSVFRTLMDLGSFGVQASFPSTASTLTFSAVASVDENKKVRVLGYDSNGNWVVDSSGTPGEEVTLAGTTVATSIVYSGVKGIQKPITAGPVTLSHTASSTVLLRAEAFMKKPLFRAYRVLDLGAQSVLALCKRRAVPVVAEEDWLFPGNLSALKLGMYALDFEENSSMGKAREYFGAGINLLNEEASHYQGGAQEQLDFQPWGPGVGGIDNIM